VRDLGDGSFEAGDGVAVGAAHGDEDECLEGEPNSDRVQLSAVAADDPRLLQGAEPAVAGSHRQTDPFGQLREGQPPVLLQLRKNLPIKPVHTEVFFR
jgi:hypothetical protein